MTTDSPSGQTSGQTSDQITGHITGQIAAPDGEGLREPLSPRWRRRLRDAVAQHARTPGRNSRPQLHVGEPDGVDLCLDVDSCEPSDPGLRTDLVATMVADARRAGVTEPLVWLTRSGDLAVQDVDTRWLTAARAAGQECQRPVAMVVVTRRGWRDPRSGVTQTWVRLRHSPRP